MMRSTVELRGPSRRAAGYRRPERLNVVWFHRWFRPRVPAVEPIRPIWRQSLDRFFVAICKEATTWQEWRT